ncbi:MAG TPA: o-succinylbenzoate--CoA ligase [Nocardioidaceae bacterium]|nr:o-succinylbenzoate--CoA ligase [Nocardioidaceae bacterium]
MTNPAPARPVRGEAEEVLAMLRAWNDAAQPPRLVVETSGSTGEPKRVLLSRDAMRASATATHARLGGPGRWLLMLPPAYVAGLQVLFRSVLAGTEPVVKAGTLADAAASMGAREEARRYVSVVPTQLARILAEPRELEALRSFDTVLVGGARLDDRLREAAASAGIRLVTTYGMSETCGGCVYDGLPLDGVAVRIAADQRVWLGGPVLFDGYDGRPGPTAEVLVDGWFRTQDTGRIDDDGRLHVLGRVDDVLISGGVNVSASAVADRLREHPAVSAVEVFGVPDPEWGQRVVAAVVGALSLDEARDWVSAVHPRAWAPREVRAMAALPLLPNGKVDRVALREAR